MTAYDRYQTDTPRGSERPHLGLYDPWNHHLRVVIPDNDDDRRRDRDQLMRILRTFILPALAIAGIGIIAYVRFFS